MNTAEAAALIAAVFWALLVSVGVFVLFRLGRLLTESSRLVTDLRQQSDALLQRAQTAVDGAQAAVDRAGRQLDRAESVTASMDELGTGMAELAGQVTALAGLGRAIAGGPVGRVGALAYGVRHAVSLRQGDRQGDRPRRPPRRRKAHGARPGRGPRRADPAGECEMIRRGFWLTAGAVTGIYGYRRVSALGRRLSASLNSAGPAQEARRAASTGRPRSAASFRSAASPPRVHRGVIGLARETYRFTRDVREGMDLYTARHSRSAGSTLSTDHEATTEAKTEATTEAKTEAKTYEPEDGH